eukprot:3498621-Karenia_brevis.AAC.1
MEDHNITGDTGPYVDRAQEEYVEALGLGRNSHHLSSLYSKWSTQASVMLAKGKSPNEMDMDQHQGLASAVVAQTII